MSELYSQADIYRQSGFLICENLLSAEETQVLRDRTRDVAEGKVSFPENDIELEPGVSTRNLETLRKLNRCAANDPVFLAHAKNARILDIVEQLIGPDIKLYDSQCFMKPPGGVEKPYHQDSAYFNIAPMDLVTCWTALDDVTTENGCMWVIPGSHRDGLVEHADWFVGDRKDKQVPQQLLELSKESPIVMPAGSCSFHHSLLLHKSAANRSVNPRRGLAVHYVSAKSRWTKPAPKLALLRGREYSGCV